jgi:DNA-binding MarR family transcriptional regulator
MLNSADRERSNQAQCRALTRVLDEFRRYETDISASGVFIFLTVAAKPGIHLKEIERATGLSSSAVHRNVRMLSDEHWRKDKEGNYLPGHDLVVMVPDPFDSRTRIVSLTPRGRKVMELALDHISTT